RRRHVPRRRPAREDGSGVDGELARGARAVPRLRRHRLRARAADAAQGTGPLEEALAAQGCGAAPSRADRQRAQTRLLDSRRRLAARRPGAFRARDARARSAPARGLPAARAGRTTARRARVRQAGLEPPALGPARVHALARAPRRTDAEGTSWL